MTMKTLKVIDDDMACYSLSRDEDSHFDRAFEIPGEEHDRITRAMKEWEWAQDRIDQLWKAARK